MNQFSFLKDQLLHADCKNFCRMVFRDKYIKGEMLTITRLHEIVHANINVFYDDCPGPRVLASWVSQFKSEII